MKNLINDLKVSNPIIDTYLGLIAQSKKFQFIETEYRGYKIDLPTKVGGKGKNPANYQEIQNAANALTQLVKNHIDNLLSEVNINASDNEAKQKNTQKIKVNFTIFALITIGGFASVCNIGNVLHLFGTEIDLVTKIACFGFGLYLSFCFAYFAILGENKKAGLTSFLLSLDVVSHFMVLVGVVSFENKWVAFAYSIYYAAQVFVSMLAISNLAENKNFMLSMFGEEIS